MEARRRQQQQQQQQNGEGRQLLQQQARIEAETLHAETTQRFGIRSTGKNPQQLDTCYDGSCSDDPTFTTSAGLGCEAHANWMRSQPGEEIKNSSYSCLDKWLNGFGDSDINQLCPITKDSTTLSVAICIQSYKYSEKDVQYKVREEQRLAKSKEAAWKQRGRRSCTARTR